MIETERKIISTIGEERLSGTYVEQIGQVLRNAFPNKTEDDISSYRNIDRIVLKNYSGEFLWSHEETADTNLFLLEPESISLDWASDVLLFSGNDETIFHDEMWKFSPIFLLMRKTNRNRLYYGKDGVVSSISYEDAVTKIGHFIHKFYGDDKLRTLAVKKRMNLEKKKDD